MPLIPLTKGYSVLVDEADVARVSAFKWCAKVCGGGKVYAARGVRNGAKVEHVYLHRWLLGVTSRRRVDHENGDTLDCRRENLRRATHRQNMQNIRVARGVSGFKGVGPTRSGRWHAAITVAGRERYLGTFQAPEAAARAYDRAAVEHFGAFAATNQSLGLLPAEAA